MCTKRRLRSAWAFAQSDQSLRFPHEENLAPIERTANTLIRLGGCPGWSESSLFAWRKRGFLTTHWAHSEDSVQTGRIPRLIRVFAVRTCYFVGCVMRWLNCSDSFLLSQQAKQHMFWVLNRGSLWGASNKYLLHLFYLFFVEKYEKNIYHDIFVSHEISSYKTGNKEDCFYQYKKTHTVEPQ